MARIRAGDREAEGSLVERFGKGIALLLDRHCRGGDAEDLFQDTFRLVIEKLRRGELRESEKLPAFLAQVARSLAIEHYRKAARRKTEPDSEALAFVPASAASPLTELLASENAALARQVVRELGTARDREILLRFYLAEDDKDTIAADHGLSSLQFNRVLHRARQRYKELYLARVAAGAGRGRAALGALVAMFLGLVPLSR
ncbi:MAG TPA: sigma-70 family RNA polymerase sigma factor [Thermoanaerobaculia bacterium]|nr:sigma-70 family RNA polymerase sigma factor [Thermoanaerobaculia bacterium]